ncbi:MAG: hypothetical protein KC620_09095 [Myxococcales bacterium]|nr:hypothetical protein [Myxococcales bacterium]
MNPLTLKLSLEEINLILEALGTQPYIRVHETIARIQQQARAQLAPQRVRPVDEDNPVIEQAG